MSSSNARRYKRKLEKLVKMGKLNDLSKDRQLFIPSEQEVEQYIKSKKFQNKMDELNKSTENGM